LKQFRDEAKYFFLVNGSSFLVDYILSKSLVLNFIAFWDLGLC
jgi:hypothetical protein